MAPRINTPRRPPRKGAKPNRRPSLEAIAGETSDVAPYQQSHLHERHGEAEHEFPSETQGVFYVLCRPCKG